MKSEVTPGYAGIMILAFIASPFYVSWGWNEFISPLGVPQINWASALAIETIIMWITNDFMHRDKFVLTNDFIIYLTNHMASSWIILFILSFFNRYF